MEVQINIGDEAKDVVTGISGIVVVRHDYLYGVPRVGIQPKGSHDGKAHQTIHVDILQAELVKEKAVSRKGTASKDQIIPLGALGKCKITGYIGICTGRAEWLYACTKVLIQGRDINPRTMKPVDAVWFDEGCVELVEQINPNLVQSEAERTTGGFDQPTSDDSFNTCN